MENSRVYVRKAQYHYGWDWGPSLITAGSWRATRIKAYHSCIVELQCLTDLASDLSSVILHIRVKTTIEATAGEVGPWQLECAVRAPNEHLVATTMFPVNSDESAR